jgi:hypothetical protein
MLLYEKKTIKIIGSIAYSGVPRNFSSSEPFHSQTILMSRELGAIVTMSKYPWAITFGAVDRYAMALGY